MLLNVASKAALLCASIITAKAQLHPSDPARYQCLPSLREQASIQDAWTNQRLEQLPTLLEKYGVDAWLVRTYSDTQQA